MSSLPPWPSFPQRETHTHTHSHRRTPTLPTTGILGSWEPNSAISHLGKLVAFSIPRQWPNEGGRSLFDVSSPHAPPVSLAATTTTWLAATTSFFFVKRLFPPSSPPPPHSLSLSSSFLFAYSLLPNFFKGPCHSLRLLLFHYFIVVSTFPPHHQPHHHYLPHYSLVFSYFRLTRGCSPPISQHTTAIDSSMIYQHRRAHPDLLPP